MWITNQNLRNIDYWTLLWYTFVNITLLYHRRKINRSLFNPGKSDRSEINLAGVALSCLKLISKQSWYQNSLLQNECKSTMLRSLVDQELKPHQVWSSFDSCDHCDPNYFPLTHFVPVRSFCIPWKHQKTSGFLMFPGGIERDQWHRLIAFCLGNH